jgi:2-hydroxy-6-oxonona-2,4-dienedioate hydrolase
VTGDGYRSIWTELRDVPFTQAWVDAAGVSTRCADAGSSDAPAVVMLHGTGGHWETFAANIGPLARHLRCIAIDMVGHGFSDKPPIDYEIAAYVDHVGAVMDALNVERASLMGTSLGSWVAARFALDRPERVDKLVLMSTAGLLASRSNMDRVRSERTKAVEDPTWESIAAIFTNLIADDRNRIPDLIALRQAIYRLPDMRDTMERILVLQDPDVRARNLLSEEQWRSIEAPALVVASGKDHNEYENTSRRVASLMPNATLLEMPHVRHWPHFEDAVTFNDAALGFLLG